MSQPIPMLQQQPQPRRNLGGGGGDSSGNGNGNNRNRNETPSQNQNQQNTKKRKYHSDAGGEGPSSVKFQVIDTGVEFTTVVYHWRLRNYAIFRKYDHLLEQQKFQFAITDKNEITTTWEFSLKRVPGNEVSDTKDWISVRQKLINIQAPPPEAGSGNGSGSGPRPPPKKIWSKCMVETKSPDGTFQLFKFKHSEKIAESTLGMVLVCKKFLPRDAKLDKLPLVNGTLTIQVTLSVYSGITLDPLTPHEDHPKLSLDALTERSISKSHEFLASLENDLESADVTITSKDGEIFHCHRLILSKKSPVFEAMLRSGNEVCTWKEKQSGAIKLEDISGRAVKILLHFIYTGQLFPDWADCSENLFEVTYAANKYDLKDLVEFLDSNLALFCGMKDALRMLVLCNKLQMKKAQREIFNNVIKKRPGNDEEFMQALMAFHDEQ